MNVKYFTKDWPIRFKRNGLGTVKQPHVHLNENFVTFRLEVQDLSKETLILWILSNHTSLLIFDMCNKLKITTSKYFILLYFVI